jgi:hypothetical protein
MPALYLFVHHDDISEIVQRLSVDEAVAFLLSDGVGQWRARQSVDTLPPGDYLLWHQPGGPLPLVESDGRVRGSVIENPWDGWREQRPGANPRVPWLGDPPQVFQFHLWPDGSPLERRSLLSSDSPYLGVSSMSWIGNHWAAVGKPAHPDTSRWWRSWTAWVRRVTTPMLATVPVNSPGNKAYAFPAAWQHLQQGASTHGPWSVPQTA